MELYINHSELSANSTISIRILNTCASPNFVVCLKNWLTYTSQSSFDVKGVVVVPASGVGNARLSLIFRRQLSLSRRLTSIKLCADRSFLTHSNQVFLGLPRPRGITRHKELLTFYILLYSRADLDIHIAVC